MSVHHGRQNEGLQRTCRSAGSFGVECQKDETNSLSTIFKSRRLTVCPLAALACLSRTARIFLFFSSLFFAKAVASLSVEES